MPSAHWTRERIIKALQWHARRRGRPPTVSEWEAAPERSFRGYKRRRRPTAATVRAVFGSWRAGLTAAGLTAQKSGGDRWERCKRGHPLTGDNVVVDGRGKRACRTCRRANDRRRARELRAQRARAGVCTRCGGERDDPDLSLCASCRATAQAKTARHRGQRAA